MRAKLNNNHVRRDEIIAPYLEEVSGGLKYFHNMHYEVLELLIKENFADPDDDVNCSPTIGEYISFMKKYPGFRAHGYTVPITRDDYRVSVEGLQGKDVQPDGFDAFIQLEHGADHFNISLKDRTAYSWWD